MGQDAADEQLALAAMARKAPEGSVDWSKWRPGDRVAALLLRPPRAFQRLLQRQGITFKDFSDTTLTDIGNAIGEAIHLGLSSNQAARRIMDHVANPARALTIAITEQNRAISEATVERYEGAGIEEQEWLVFLPCDRCKQNANEVRRLRQPFPSGDAQPPAHPNCRCALAPVIPGFDEPSYTGGQVDIAPPVAAIDDDEIFSAAATRTFEPGNDDELYATLRDEQRAYIESLTQDEMQAIASYQSMDYEDINAGLRGNATLRAEYDKTIRTVDRVIDKASLDFNTTVYRGISDDTGAFDNIQIGDRITDKGFLSTSPNPAVAEAFANSTVIQGKPVVLEIEVPMGQPALASDVASARLAGEIETGASLRLADDDMIAEIAGYVRLNEVTLPRDLPLEVVQILEKENAKYVKVRIAR